MEEHVWFEARLAEVIQRAGLDLPGDDDLSSKPEGQDPHPDLPSVKRCHLEVIAEQGREDHEDMAAGDGAPIPLRLNNEVGCATSADGFGNEIDNCMRIVSLKNNALVLLRSLESDMDADPTSTVYPEPVRPKRRRQRAEDFF